MPDDTILEEALAIVGDEDIVLGFKALGFKVYAVNEAAEAESIMNEIIKNGTGICLIQDNLYLKARDAIAQIKGLPLPVVIPFGKDGSVARLESMITDIRLRATGTLGL